MGSVFFNGTEYRDVGELGLYRSAGSLCFIWQQHKKFNDQGKGGSIAWPNLTKDIVTGIALEYDQIDPIMGWP